MEIIQELGRSVLIVDDATINQNEYMRQMIVDNTILGLLQCKMGLHDNRNVLKYDVTNKVSFAKKYEKKEMTGEEIATFFIRLSELMENCRKYLLSEDFFIYSPDLIFCDLTSDELSLIYIPFKYEENRFENEGRFRELADFFLEKINHKDVRAVDIAYSFYKMSKESLFSVEAFCNLYCRDLNNDRETEAAKKSGVADYVDDDMDEVKKSDCVEYRDECEAVAPKRKISWSKQIGLIIASSLLIVVSKTLLNHNPYAVYLMYLAFLLLITALVMAIWNIISVRRSKEDAEAIKSVKVNVEEYWYDDGETQFFDDGMTVFFDTNSFSDGNHRLSWKVAGEERMEAISKFPCIIGKKYDEVDICIGDDSVSRIHASINRKNGELYLKDLGSTNGSFVNGNKLLKNEEIKIVTGSQIRFGKVDVNVV